MLKIEEVKKQFPIFNNESSHLNGRELVYLDNAATTQKPARVIEAIKNYYETSNANVHRGIYDLSERSTKVYEEAREEVSKFINGASGYSIFTSGTTESLNLAARLVEQKLSAGDVILTTEVEHHSNMLPWMELAKRKGAELRFVKVGSDGEISLEAVKKALDGVKAEKLKAVALTHCSNVTGLVTDLSPIVQYIRGFNKETLVVVDGAQAVAHIPVDVKSLDADFYAFSGHKMYGPMGIGVLWGKGAVLDALEPVKFGGGMINSVEFNKWEAAEGVDKWEAGTPNVAGAVGLAEAIRFLNEIGFEAIISHEMALKEKFEALLADFPGVKTLSKPDIALFSLSFDKYHPHDVAQVLADSNIAVRAGHHCVQPYHKKLGINGSVRVSFGVYNEEVDIERFFETLKSLEQIFG